MHANSETPDPIVERELSHRIVGAFFFVYNRLGYGFVESIYSKALCVALQQRSVNVQREVPIVVLFEGVEVGHHRADILVDNSVIVEIKATDRIADAHKKQVRNYLVALNLRLGLLLHFGPTAQVHRILNPTRNHLRNSQ
jgi:GxxExxY protein